MNSTAFDLTGRISNPRSLTLKAISLLLHQSAPALGVSVKSVHLVAGRLGFYSQSGHTKDFKNSIRSFRARRSAQAEVRRVLCMCCSSCMSLNSVQSFVIENCNGPTIENGLNNVCLHPLSRTFTFTPISRLPIRLVDVRILANSRGNSRMSNFTFCILYRKILVFAYIPKIVSCKTNLDLLLMCYWYALMAETALPV